MKRSFIICLLVAGLAGALAGWPGLNGEKGGGGQQHRLSVAEVYFEEGASSQPSAAIAACMLFLGTTGLIWLTTAQSSCR